MTVTLGRWVVVQHLRTALDAEAGKAEAGKKANLGARESRDGRRCESMCVGAPGSSEALCAARAAAHDAAASTGARTRREQDTMQTGRERERHGVPLVP